MTLKNRLSKLEASISPSRPYKVVTIQCCRDDDEGRNAARDRHFAAHPEDRDANVVVFLRKIFGGDDECSPTVVL
jgi:hypothetical protein